MIRPNPPRGLAAPCPGGYGAGLAAVQPARGPALVKRPARGLSAASAGAQAGAPLQAIGQGHRSRARRWPAPARGLPAARRSPSDRQAAQGLRRGDAGPARAETACRGRHGNRLQSRRAARSSGAGPARHGGQWCDPRPEQGALASWPSRLVRVELQVAAVVWHRAPADRQQT